MCGHMTGSAKLIFLCGKMAAGKSTLARELADRENAVLLVQDDFVTALFPGEITDIPSFVNRYTRLKNALTPHICVLLSKRISVVLDFAAATKAQRAWFRELIERTQVEHELHFVDASDAVCKTRIAFCGRVRRRVQNTASGSKQRATCRNPLDHGGRL